MINVAINVSNCVAGGGRAIADWFLQELNLRGLPDSLNVSIIANSIHTDAFIASRFQQVLMLDTSPVRSASARRRAHSFLQENQVSLLFSLFGPSGLKHSYQIAGLANAFITSDQRDILKKVYGKYWLAHELKYRLLRNSLTSGCKYLFFETDEERLSFTRMTSFNAKATGVIPNSVNPQINAASRFSFRDLRIGVDELKILVVTSDYGHKNNGMLATYLSALKEVWQGPVSMSVTLTTAQLKSAQNVQVVGEGFRTLGRLEPSELAQAYIDADLVLMPSMLETYSAVYNEVRFFGKPLLCSDIPSAREICARYAVFFSPKDLHHLKHQFRDLLRYRREIADRTWNSRSATILPSHKFELLSGLITEHAKIATKK